MNKSSLKFIMKDINDINEFDKEILLNAYHNLFIKTYGVDVVDAFSKVTNIDVDEVVDRDDNVKSSATNYNKSINALEEFRNNANLELLLIYYEDNLVGCAKQVRIDDETVKVPEIAFHNIDKSIERDLWKETVSYISKHFQKQNYKKMYLEIPLKEGPLLIRAGELGFIESPEDILGLEKTYTYILNKKL